MAAIDDYKDVIRLAYQTEAYWQQSKLEMVKGHHWYTLNVPIATPKGIEYSAPPTAPSLVNDAADHLAGGWPRFEVKPLKETQKAEIEQERVEHCLDGLFKVLGRDYGHALHRVLAIHGGWAGMMAARVGLREDWDIENPSIKDFYWQPVDPRYLFPDPGSLGKEFVIYRMRRTVGSIRQAWPDWEGQWYPTAGWGFYNTGPDSRPRLAERLPDFHVVDWIEYWDDEVKCFIANGKPVFVDTFGADVIPHLLGCNPFVIKASGWGDATGEPHERFRSMLFYVFHLLELEAKLLVQYKWIIEDTAWPTWLAPSAMRGLDIQPGTINFIDDPEAIKAFRSVRDDAVDPKAVVDLLAWVQDAIEKATYPQVLKGQGPNGIRSGYPIAILSTQAKLKFAPAADALAAIMEELSYKTLKIVRDRIRVPVDCIEGYSIKPEDYDNYMGRIDVELEPKLPSDLAAQLPMYEFFVGSLGMSKADAARMMGMENPIESRQQRMAENLEEDPRVQQVMAEHLVKFLVPDAAAAVEQVAQPAIEAQQLQEQMQVLQAAAGQMQMAMQVFQMLPQFRQALQMFQQGGGQMPPQQAGMTPEAAAMMGAAPGSTPPAAPSGAGQPQPTVQGGPGGTIAGQALGLPNQQGQSLQTVNPMTATTGIAREMRSQRAIVGDEAQDLLYGNPETTL